MKYKTISKKKMGDRTMRDSVHMEDGKVKHFQVETRNGKVFMRMKTRTVRQ